MTRTEHQPIDSASSSKRGSAHPYIWSESSSSPPPPWCGSGQGQDLEQLGNCKEMIHQTPSQQEKLKRFEPTAPAHQRVQITRVINYSMILPCYTTPTNEKCPIPIWYLIYKGLCSGNWSWGASELGGRKVQTKQIRLRKKQIKEWCMLIQMSRINSLPAAFCCYWVDFDRQRSTCRASFRKISDHTASRAHVMDWEILAWSM